MRGVSKRVRVVALAFAVGLFAANAVSAMPREGAERLIDRIIVWLQSRLSIPPGNS